MRSIYLNVGKASHLIFIFIIGISIYYGSVGTTYAQKPPLLERNKDDYQLCGKNPAPIEFCKYFNEYIDNKNGNDAGKAIAAHARNEMIEILRGQIDEYYKSHKDGRRLKATWLQMIFDILEIGTATTIDFINGERAKSVLAAVLTGFQGGRSAFNRNFKILQLQLLINKMNGDRNTILEKIYKNTNKGIDEYSWLKAKNDLRNYLFAGTFGNAMDSLVETTGKDADDAKKAMEDAKADAGVVRAPSANELSFATEASNILQSLGNAFDQTKPDTDAQKAIVAKYKNIYVAINANSKLRQKLNTLKDNTQFDPEFGKKLDGIVKRMAAGETLSALEYDQVYSNMIGVVSGDSELSTAYLAILKANKN